MLSLKHLLHCLFGPFESFHHIRLLGRGDVRGVVKCYLYKYILPCTEITRRPIWSTCCWCGMTCIRGHCCYCSFSSARNPRSEFQIHLPSRRTQLRAGRRRPPPLQLLGRSLSWHSNTARSEDDGRRHWWNLLLSLGRSWCCCQLGQYWALTEVDADSSEMAKPWPHSYCCGHLDQLLDLGCSWFCCQLGHCMA